MGKADACRPGLAEPLRNHRDTPPVDVILSWQVSWLAGRRLCPSSRGFHPSDVVDKDSPLTVAGAAPVLPIFGAPDSLLAPG